MSSWPGHPPPVSPPYRREGRRRRAEGRSQATGCHEVMGCTKEHLRCRGGASPRQEHGEGLRAPICLMCDYWLVGTVVQVFSRGELQHREPRWLQTLKTAAPAAGSCIQGPLRGTKRLSDFGHIPDRQS